MDTIRHKGESLIPGIAYGDAAGLPVETQTSDSIYVAYGTIQNLIPSSRNPFYEGEHEVGMWSDDTQLSIAVAEALIEADGFNIDTMARQHLIAYDTTDDVVRNGKLTKRGWGGSTVNAMRKLQAGVSPSESGTVGGAGNGVLMKMAPLAYWHAVRRISDDERHADYDALTAMTHDSPVARLSSRIHGDVLKHLISNGYDREEFLNVLFDAVSYHEAATGVEGEAASTLSYLRGLQEKMDIHQNTTAKESFYAPHTLAMAYGAFVLNDGRFNDSVFEAVNLGGDTDSTASIAAAMSTFATKEKVQLPADHRQLDQLPMLQGISKQLAHKALLSIEAS